MAVLSTNLGFEIKTETTEVAEVKAVIDKESAIGDDLPLNIDELVASIATGCASQSLRLTPSGRGAGRLSSRWSWTR